MSRFRDIIQRPGRTQVCCVMVSKHCFCSVDTSVQGVKGYEIITGTIPPRASVSASFSNYQDYTLL